MTKHRTKNYEKQNYSNNAYGNNYFRDNADSRDFADGNITSNAPATFSAFSLPFSTTHGSI
jgi:hypothetical protein